MSAYTGRPGAPPPLVLWWRSWQQFTATLAAAPKGTTRIQVQFSTTAGGWLDDCAVVAPVEPRAISWSQTYNYDGFGNMTQKATSPGGVMSVAIDPLTNRITSEPYDASGNMLGPTVTYMRNGQQIIGPANTWDAENHLVFQVRDTQQITMVYDPFGHPDCETVLKGKGKSLNDLSDTLSQTGFARTNGYEGQLTVRELTGTPEAPLQSVASIKYGPKDVAFAVGLVGGPVLKLIALTPGYSQMSETLQTSTLLGELMHIVFQKDDDDILGVFGIQQSTGQSTSEAFHEWVDRDCK